MRFCLYLFCLALLVSCASEEKAGPAAASTFLRYFNGGNNDEARAIIQTEDQGFIILANTAIKPSELIEAHYKIKLIKTDAYGNQQWQKFYPAYGEDDNTQGNSKLSYKGNGIQILSNGGYVITGEDIQNNSSQLMIMTVDSEGNTPHYKTIKSTLSMSGTAVTTDSNGNFLALGAISNSTNVKNMVLCKFRKTSLDSIWTGTYGAGTVINLASKLYLDAGDNAFWGGTIRKDNTTNAIRFIKIITADGNEGGIDFDLPLSKPGITETGNDICRFGNGFAIIGTTNEKRGGALGDFDILFKRVSADGIELSSKSFPVTNQNQEDQGQNETGNALCTTRDGGMLLLGTIDTQGTLGRGDKDFYLIKTDAFGTVEWTQSYGSKFEDIGVSVIRTNDGGYVVLGTTTLSRVKTITLLKVNGTGNLE